MSDLENEEKSEEFMFDPTFKKKKKKKPKVAFETEIEQEEEGDNQARNAPADENEKEVEEETPAEPSDFTDLPKIKKKKKKTMTEFIEQLNDEAEKDVRADDDLFVPESEQMDKETKFEEAWLSSDRDYTYQELLGRVFHILRQNNPELAGEKKRYTIAPPSVHREGNKKTIFANVIDICKKMHRQPEHVIQFLFAELGTSGSIDGSQRLIIKGRFQQKQLENVLRRYIVEYVTCKTCKSPDTILTKENRIFFQQCESCGSMRSVSAIKTGFKAQTEKRAAQRRAAVQ
ncbi:450_t:CDS:2 [Acaulospora morrowiae]|uniref:450_t:CDS:1 n=1 Tax=Acaulospora morrowiae TaxID=94023 RepID=A0A9N9B320_9GLOM|nr:450_t:CDS:2 [Acaulospora morrowiae]